MNAEPRGVSHGNGSGRTAEAQAPCGRSIGCGRLSSRAGRRPHALHIGRRLFVLSANIPLFVSVVPACS